MPKVLPAYLQDSALNNWQLVLDSQQRTSLAGPVTLSFNPPPYFTMNSVTDGLSYEVSAQPDGTILVVGATPGVYPTQLLLPDPFGNVYAVQIATVTPPTLSTPAEGMIQIDNTLQPNIGSPSFPTTGARSFNVISLEVPDRYIGERSSYVLPCVPGDTITFTPTIRWLSGGMRPRIGIFFYDVTMSTYLGSLQVSPPNTDNGWHIASVTCLAPANSAFMLVKTDCEYLPAPELAVSAHTTGAVYSGTNVVIPTNNTNDMVVGNQVVVASPIRPHPDIIFRGGGGGGNGQVSETTTIGAVNSGLSFTASELVNSYPTNSAVTASANPASSYAASFFAPGLPTPGGPSDTSWEVSNYRITQNGNPVYAPLDTLSYFTTAYNFLNEFIYPLYYLGLFSSQYQQAPNLYAWSATLVQPTTDLFACLQQMYEAFDVTQAVGTQLDIIGSIVGVDRILPYTPSTGAVNATLTSSVAPGLNSVQVNNTINMFVGEQVQVYLQIFHVPNVETVTIDAVVPNSSFTATFAYGHAAGQAVQANGVALSPTLSDVDFRTLILAKIAQNQWNGQASSLYPLFQQLFPGAHIYILDNQNMTATIVLAGTFSAIQQSMILNGLIIPRPQGVLYNFSFAELPIFGADQNTATIAGADIGHAA